MPLIDAHRDIDASQALHHAWCKAEFNQKPSSGCT